LKAILQQAVLAAYGIVARTGVMKQAWAAFETPIRKITPGEFAARLPEAAKRDLVEWDPNQSLIEVTNNVLSRRVAIGTVLQADLPAEITDARLYNEYFILRRRSPFVLRLILNARLVKRQRRLRRLHDEVEQGSGGGQSKLWFKR